MNGIFKESTRSSIKVSVVIPVYNGGRYISNAIESILNQTYTNVEVIVVDDGSTDDTYEKIKPYLPEIKYIRQENSGVCNARNAGIISSTGDLISFLDHDDEWLPKKTEKQVNYLLSSPQCKFVHCSFKYINSAGEIIKPSGYWEELKIKRGNNVKEIFIHYSILPSTMMIRREVFDEVGFWDQSLALCEGYDLCLRIALKYSLGFIDESLVLYRLHDSNCSGDSLRFDRKRIEVLESFIEKNPSVHGVIGRDSINARLFNLYTEMANNYLWLGRDECEARRYFWKAYKTNPWNVGLLGKVICYSIPRSQRNLLEWYRKKLMSVIGKI